MLDRPAIRHDLRPGDLGLVVALHGREYAEGWGLDATFETHVARQVAEYGEELAIDPEAGRLWIADQGDTMIGSIAVTRDSPTDCHLRWFCLARHARGQGLGRRMLDGALAYARERGFTTMALETFSELHAAAHLYREAGFVMLDEQPIPRWGRTIELRHYELKL
jgi:GNAT superfamily N-acetyltransferase